MLTDNMQPSNIKQHCKNTSIVSRTVANWESGFDLQFCCSKCKVLLRLFPKSNSMIFFPFQAILTWCRAQCTTERGEEQKEAVGGFSYISHFDFLIFLIFISNRYSFFSFQFLIDFFIFLVLISNCFSYFSHFDF